MNDHDKISLIENILKEDGCIEFNKNSEYGKRNHMDNEFKYTCFTFKGQRQYANTLDELFEKIDDYESDKKNLEREDEERWNTIPVLIAMKNRMEVNRPNWLDLDFFERLSIASNNYYKENNG